MTLSRCRAIFFDGNNGDASPQRGDPEEYWKAAKAGRVASAGKRFRSSGDQLMEALLEEREVIGREIIPPHREKHAVDGRDADHDGNGVQEQGGAGALPTRFRLFPQSA